MLSSRVGIAALSQWNFDQEFANQALDKCSGLTEKLLGHRSVKFPDIITDKATAKVCSDFFYLEKVNCIILIGGSFAPGTLAPYIAQRLGVPILIWAIPEPPFKDNIVNTLSLCGSNFNSSTLWKISHPFDFILLDPEDKNAQLLLGAKLKVLEAYHNFRSGVFGLVGYRVPGFYLSGFDELRLRRIFGAEVVQMDVAELFQRIDSREVTDAEIESVSERVLPKSAKIRVAADKLRNSISLYIALETWVKENDLQLLALKCWPDFPNIRQEMPCAAMGWLTNSGIPTACEADMLGAASMLLGQILSDKPTFIADLYVRDLEANTLDFWHCGSAPWGLATNSEIVFDEHSRKPGMGSVGEFSLAEGDVTILRISEGRTGYRVLAIPGKAIPTTPVVRGNLLKIRLETSVEEVTENLIMNGFEHHYIIAYGNLANELSSWSRLFGISVFDGKTWQMLGE